MAWRQLSKSLQVLTALLLTAFGINSLSAAASLQPLVDVVRQDDMLAVWPSAYPADTVLDFFTYAGAPATYNLGTRCWWWFVLGI
jgi:hypothetical protein